MPFKSDEYTLKSYQEEASQFSSDNKKTLLALPTGSGKTLTAAHAIYTTFKKDFTIFWVTEKVAIPDTYEAMLQFFDAGDFIPWNTSGYNFTEREEIYLEVLDGSVNAMIMTYALLRNDREYLLPIIQNLKSQGRKVILVLDEASQIKNPNSINFLVAQKLSKLADMTIALTATPISSKLSDIHSIVKSFGLKSYMTDSEFENTFTINQLATTGFLFKIRGTKLRVDSDQDPLPNRVYKAGRAYFKIPWKIPLGIWIDKLVLKGVRVKEVGSSGSVRLASAKPLKPGLHVHTLEALLNFGTVSSHGEAHLYVPITRRTDGYDVNFRSIPFEVHYTSHISKTKKKMDCVISFRYTIEGTVLGYKNLASYKDSVSNVLYSMSKSMVGDIPNSVLVSRYYETDDYTRKAVATVYAESIMQTSVARITIASSNPSLILEDDKDYVNSKLKLLLADLETEVSNEPILIFSPYVKTLNFLYEVISKKHKVSIYHGQLNDKVKLENKNDFRSGRTNILLMSTAASKGVNLQNARSVFFYDYPFTAENFQQISGRISRLGSKHKKLLVYSYLSESSSAIENCLYNSVQAQMNFIDKVDSNLVDKDLIDRDIKDFLDPEDSNQYLLTRLGLSKSYYCK